MCNYVTGFSRQSRSGNPCESLGLVSSLLLSALAVKCDNEDDNRGSGR
jgi:hypothetical protein